MSSEIPEQFSNVIHDFLNDLNTTFPEYAFMWKKWTNGENTAELFQYMLKCYPERFFDILYQNEEVLTNKDVDSPVYFLPNVDFRLLYNCEGVSQHTRDSIWKYLQLILMTIVGSINNKSDFGETANMFEGIDEKELQSKLFETVNGIQDFFSKSGMGLDGEGGAEFDEEGLKSKMEHAFEEMKGVFEGQGENTETHDIGGGDGKVPDASHLHEHLKGLFDGKIGNLAKELADELAKDMFGDEADNLENMGAKSTQDVLKKMLKNPKKIMEMMKKIGGKLTDKMKSGEITEQDIMSEAGEIISKMKSMGAGGKGGTAEFANLFKNLTKNMGGDFAGAKFNTGAFQAFERKYAAKERMKQKLDQKKMAAGCNIEEKTSNKYVFRVDEDEVQEKSAIGVGTPAPAPAHTDEELIAMFGEGGDSSVAKTGDGKKKKSKKKSTTKK